MIRSRTAPFLAVALLLGLAPVSMALEAPASGQRDQNRVVAEIRQLQAQLATLAEAQTALGEAVERLLADREEQVAADRRSRAETLNALDRMERNVATLSEAFRESNERLSTLMAEVESVRAAQRQAALAQVNPAEADEGAEAPETGDEEPATPEEADAAAEEDPGEDAAAPEGATVLDAPGVSAIYMEAQSDYYQGRYDLAMTGLEQVVELGGELADNARYLMGECLLAQDRLEDAVEQFDLLIEEFPNSNKIGEAWYKKGLIFGQLGHASDAREIFEEILNAFAGTPAARLAKRELDAMPPRDPGL